MVPGVPGMMLVHTSKGKAMAYRIAISLAAATMGISCIASDASAACKFKAKKDITVILDVGHSDKDSGQISARGLKEYDFNMNLARRVLEELVNSDNQTNGYRQFQDTSNAG
jgi:N-acetylmuramoyl-L-alanine amidase